MIHKFCKEIKIKSLYKISLSQKYKNCNVVRINKGQIRKYYLCYKINYKGETIIMKNESIKCTIKTCKHHAKDENYCSLDSILVGTHEANPTEKACTDCESFELKSGCCK